MRGCKHFLAIIGFLFSLSESDPNSNQTLRPLVCLEILVEAARIRSQGQFTDSPKIVFLHWGSNEQTLKNDGQILIT